MAITSAHRRPPFCPNPRCKSRGRSSTWRFVKKGFYLRDRKPYRVQRYRCSLCGRYFSSQTFSVSYWLRRADLLETTFHRLVSCSAFRQIARESRVSHSTIRRISDRLGRHSLLFHERVKPEDGPREPLVLDGFRSFEHSQYWPMDLNLLVGDSYFVYGFNDAELRRSGQMKPSQREKRRILEKRFGRPDPQATRKRVEELLRRCVPEGGRVMLRSDEHQGYPQAIKRLQNRTVDHHTTSSKASRTSSNPLFPVNHADLLLRHSSANHKRETVAFSKRRQSALYRLAIWVVWRNYMKERSENHGGGPPAKRIGLTGRSLQLEEILAQRLFPDREGISGWLRRCYFGRIPTRAIRNCVAHTAKYAV